MSHRIFITGSGIAEQAERFLLENDCVFEVGQPKDTPEDIARKVGDFNPDGMIVRQGKITGDVMDAASNLRVICKHGVGLDNIDIEAASLRKLPVMFTPGANFESVAQHALALILSLARQVPSQDRKIRGGVFDKKGYNGIELTGKTLGLIGWGAIAKRLAELVAPFNMQVLAFHPSKTDEPLPAYISKANTVEDIYRQSDIISLHSPLTTETKGMINAHTMGMMKPSVLIINTARGAIINEPDLIAALTEHRIGGAALDTFETEPLPDDSPLRQLDNVILTTHVAGMSDASVVNMGMGAAKNILAVLRGEPIDTTAVKNKAVVN